MARKRKAGDGTVRQRKDGRWEGRIVIGYDDNGYPKTKNVLAKTKKECVEKLQKLKEECGGLKPEKVRSEMVFGDWLTYWYLPQRNAAPLRTEVGVQRRAGAPSAAGDAGTGACHAGRHM